MASELNSDEVLFVGKSRSVVNWYRCCLPARFLGCHWVGVRGQPPNMVATSGPEWGKIGFDYMASHKVVILQQPYGTKWVETIRALQQLGVRVLYEIDDYIHGIRKLEFHGNKKHFQPKQLLEHEICMKASDALIVSTKFLAQRYRKFNQEIYVCENGLDSGRYNVTRPKRQQFTIGWAGGTGHERSVAPWVAVVSDMMAQRDDVCFVSIGMPLANALIRRFGHERALHIPFTMVETYPAAMTHMDLALAPSGKGDFFKAKSHLRWYEASMLGIPTVADPFLYTEIQDGITGFHADGLDDLKRTLGILVENRVSADRVGSQAREYVKEYHSIEKKSLAWIEAFTGRQEK